MTKIITYGRDFNQSRPTFNRTLMVIDLDDRGQLRESFMETSEVYDLINGIISTDDFEFDSNSMAGQQVRSIFSLVFNATPIRSIDFLFSGVPGHEFGAPYELSSSEITSSSLAILWSHDLNILGDVISTYLPDTPLNDGTFNTEDFTDLDVLWELELHLIIVENGISLNFNFMSKFRLENNTGTPVSIISNELR